MDATSGIVFVYEFENLWLMWFKESINFFIGHYFLNIKKKKKEIKNICFSHSVSSYFYFLPVGSILGVVLNMTNDIFDGDFENQDSFLYTLS